MKHCFFKINKLRSVIVLGVFFISAISYLGNTPPAFANPSISPIIASLFSFSGSRPTNLGIQDGQLAPCPPTPNCVSSQSSDSDHQIQPLSYTGSGTEAIAQLTTQLENINNAKIITADDHYIYAEFTSAIMGFVDDVEFYLDDAAQMIHIRSASRLGESDLGVNRQRIESIRSQFNA